MSYQWTWRFMKTSPSPTKNALRPDLCVTPVFVFIGILQAESVADACFHSTPAPSAVFNSHSEQWVQLRASSLWISPRCGIQWCGSHPNVDVTKDPLWVPCQILSPAACVTVGWSRFSWKKQYISHVCGGRMENIPVFKILSAHGNHLFSPFTRNLTSPESFQH